MDPMNEYTAKQLIHERVTVARPRFPEQTRGRRSRTADLLRRMTGRSKG